MTIKVNNDKIICDLTQLLLKQMKKTNEMIEKYLIYVDENVKKQKENEQIERLNFLIFVFLFFIITLLVLFKIKNL